VTPLAIGYGALVLALFAILAGVSVPVALILAAFGGVWAIKGSLELAVTLVAQAANESIASYFFGVIPLFVMMGLIVAETGIARDAFTVAAIGSRRMRGGLGIATVLANAVFAAITGVSVASAAVFARVAVPEMRRHGYSLRYATGVVAGSSVLGMLIPPSLLLIVYAILADQSIGELFSAGIVPGLLLVALYALGLGVHAFATGQGGTKAAALEPIDGAAYGAWQLVSMSLPLLLLATLVLGGLHLGWFTPVEGGAIGASGAWLLALLRGRLHRTVITRVLLETGMITASICVLIIAARTFARMLSFAGIPAGIAGWVLQVQPGYWGLMLGWVALLILMGTVLDSASVLLIAVPIMLPVVAPLELDLVWFGIVSVISVEIGLLTPPFGLSVHTIHATLDDGNLRPGDIFLGSVPYVLAMLVLLGLLIAQPWLAGGGTSG